jgi:uncharacterized protein
LPFGKGLCRLKNIMQIKHSETENGGEFVIEQDGDRAAEMGYTNAGAGKIIIDHTFVEKDLRGEGIGGDLIKAGVEFARDKNLKVIALCPFAKAVIERTLEFQDVLAD